MMERRARVRNVKGVPSGSRGPEVTLLPSGGVRAPGRALEARAPAS